jgi:hypothetical protein
LKRFPSRAFSQNTRNLCWVRILGDFAVPVLIFCPVLRKNIDPKDLVFLDEMGVLHELIRTHARAASGESLRLQDFLSGWQSEHYWGD